jgi:ABC-type transport system involved in multi-copper enzyme maturation permease subunit
MNPLLKKEIRLLLPSFLASLLMALAIWLVPEDLDHSSFFAKILIIFPFLFCPVMVVMMTLGAFGREFSSGTFSMLLAQPVPRARIWSAKTLPLAVMVTLVWFVWCISDILHNPGNQSSDDLRDMEICTALFALAFFSGGLWSVLLFRQMAAGFWFAVLTPSALLVTIVDLLDGHPDKFVARVLIATFIVYGIAGFIFARWIFSRVQDAQWTGGDIAMPEMRGLKWWGERPREPQSGVNTGSSAASPRRIWRPRAALLAKEFQLHQSQFIMAGVLVLLHLGVIATRKFGNLRNYPDLKFVLEQFWFLWLVMPFLVGCAAVAEERKLGTLEGQLCLPAKRRTQFGLKLFVVLVLSVLLGTIMPLLLEGTRILPGYKLDFPKGLMDDYLVASNVWWQFALNILATIWFSLPLLTFVIISLGMAAMAFYASTLTRNTLQALAPAVLGSLLTWFLLVEASEPEDFSRYLLWRGWLIYLIGVPVLTVVVAALAYGNYKRVLVGWSAWRRNLLTLAITLALVISATAAIYHRAWELLGTTEPPHGVARLMPNQARMRVNGENITVFLPDGRVWMDRYVLFAVNPFTSQLKENPMFGGGKFLDGTNWLDAEDCWWDIAGIQRDGSLWVSEKPDQRLRPWPKGKMPASESTKLARFGNENDWKNISGYAISPFLLKTDGTLWIWGTNRWDWKKKWPGLHVFQPRQLGTNSDWAEMFTDDGRTIFRKTNGEVWAYPEFSTEDAKLVLNEQFTFYRASYLPTNHWRSTFWCNVYTSPGFQAGVCEDGTFRELANWQKISHGSKWGLASRNIQIGTETNWLAAVGFENKPVSLKADGTLWRWEFEKSPDINPHGFSVNRFSEHSDWVAIAPMMSGFVSLAADGGLWLWRFEPQDYDFGSDYIPWLLANSRKPQYLGNIFGKAD